MAELHVQTKKNSNATPMWVWILVGLVVIAAIAFFVLRNNDKNDNTRVDKANPTSFVQPQQAVDFYYS